MKFMRRMLGIILRMRDCKYSRRSPVRRMKAKVGIHDQYHGTRSFRTEHALGAVGMYLASIGWRDAVFRVAPAAVPWATFWFEYKGGKAPDALVTSLWRIFSAVPCRRSKTVLSGSPLILPDLLIGLPSKSSSCKFSIICLMIKRSIRSVIARPSCGSWGSLWINASLMPRLLGVFSRNPRPGQHHRDALCTI